MLPQAETRAEFAERSVAKLEKTIDDLEGMEPGSGIRTQKHRGGPCPLTVGLVPWTPEGVGSDVACLLDHKLLTWLQPQNWVFTFNCFSFTKTLRTLLEFASFPWKRLVVAAFASSRFRSL